MNADLMQRWAALTKALEGDTATLQSLRKAQMLLVAGCWVMVLAAVALKLMGALTQIVFMLGVLGACCGGASLLVGRKLATVRRRAESRRDEMQHMIEVVQRQEQSARIPLCIGFANLSGADLDDIAAEDARALGPLFMRARVTAHGQIPSAEVLFVYAHLNEDGTLKGPKPTGIRQIVQATHAAIVVLASPNTEASIQNAIGLRGPKSANLVFTLGRNGSGFPRFFTALFEKMQTGQDMLSAWAAIAPQHPDAQPADAPSTLLVAEGGKIAFPPA